jgi:beta-glucuronidase
MVTEFGAEANREGSVEDKGTYAFQQDYVNYNLGVMATKPWLSGALYWALNEFRVRPEWEGGNPFSTSPIHQKGLLTYELEPKPAFADAQRWFRQTNQFGEPAN